MRGKRKASKHKINPDEDDDGQEKQTRNKRALFCENTRLIAAVDQHDFVTVRSILENKYSKLSKSCLNNALLKVVEKGKKQIVLLLLDYGVDVSEFHKTGTPALVAATERGYWDIVKQLVTKGAPVDGKNSAGKTALMVAVEKSCSSNLVSFLIDDCKADINLQDNDGQTALMMAVEQWDFATVQALLMSKHYVCDYSIKTKDGFSALDLAKRNGSIKVINILMQSHRKLISPLSMVAGINNIHLARQLIETYPSCVESLEIGAPPLTAAMYGPNKKQDKWDGKIHCSLELIELLLQSGVDVNKHHPCGFTPLMFAALAGSEKIVQMLLAHGADPDKSSTEGSDNKTKGQTALMMATGKGFVKIVDMLIEAGSNLIKTDHSGENALNLAVKGGESVCIQTLLKHWKDLTETDIKLMEGKNILDVLLNVKDRWSQLFKDTSIVHEFFPKAIQARSFPLVKALVDFGADINTWLNDSCPLFVALKDLKMTRFILDLRANVNARQNSESYTALMQAAMDNNVPLIRMLLNYKADMYVESNGSTALTLAISNNKTKAVMALLDGGINVNHVTSFPRHTSALWCAITAKNYTLTETLIKRGADVTFANFEGVTVLMLAIKKDCTPKVLELILRKGADVNALDDNTDSALLYALSNDEKTKEKVSLLLRYGADIDHTNFQSVTPLMEAAETCNADVLRVLLAKKPLVNIKNWDGNTALHFAVQERYDKIGKAKALLNSGADINVMNYDFETPLMVALENIQGKNVMCLIRHGADVHFKKSHLAQKWKQTLNSSFNDFGSFATHDEDAAIFSECLEALLEAGCSLHCVQESKLDTYLALCTFRKDSKMVQLLLQSGLRPNLFDMPSAFEIKKSILRLDSKDMLLSPLMNAICSLAPEIIVLMSQACFYHPHDIGMLQSKKVRGLLRILSLTRESFSADQLQPANWSLRTWSKLAVLRAVGYGAGREARLRALPISAELRDELLLKNIGCSS